MQCATCRPIYSLDETFASSPYRSAEMYNPETDQWTQVRDMPVALHSAKMELLNGIPTLIGGYNTETRKANK